MTGVQTCALPIYTGIVSAQSGSGLIDVLQNEKFTSADKLKDLTEDQEGLKKASQEFESIFINMLLQEFRKSIPEDGIIPRSFTTQAYEEMFDRQMATDLGQSESFGIGEILFRQLSGKRYETMSQNTAAEKGSFLERKG